MPPRRCRGEIRAQEDRDRGGRCQAATIPRARPVALPVPAAEVLKLVFATNEGQTSRVTESRDGAIFVVRVSKVTPPDGQAACRGQGPSRRGLARRQAAREGRQNRPRNSPPRSSRMPDLATVAAEKGLKVTTSPPLLRRPGGATRSCRRRRRRSSPSCSRPSRARSSPPPMRPGSYVAQLDEVQAEETPSKSATADLSA